MRNRDEVGATDPAGEASDVGSGVERLAMANARLQGDLVRAPEVSWAHLAERAVVGIALLADGTLSYVNPALAAMVGFASDSVRDLQDFLFRHAGDDILAAVLRLEASGAVPHTLVRTWPRRDGVAFRGRMTLSRLAEDLPGEVMLQLQHLDDVDPGEHVSRESLEFALESSGQGVWDIDEVNRTVRFSRSWRNILGFEPPDDLGRSAAMWLDSIHPDDIQAVRDVIAAGGDAESVFEYRRQVRDGSWRWFLTRGRTVAWQPDGSPARIIGTDTDITAVKEMEQRRAVEEAKAHRRSVEQLQKASRAAEAAQKLAASLARHDPVTGLPNRRRFTEVLAKAVSGDKAVDHALLLVDLDRFKPVNDLHGHRVGDTVLREIAQRLSRAAPDGATVARVGGDEFAIIVPANGDGILGHAFLDGLARGIISAVSETILVDVVSASVGASIGVVTYPADGTAAEDLLRRADVAMYAAKKAGRGRYRFFDRRMEVELRAEAALEADVRKAVAGGTIVPHYQPIVDLETSVPYGFEVLARWDHSDRGAVPPSTFIAIAERLDLVAGLTFDLFRRCCMEMAGWPGRPMVGVNISPLHFTDPSFTSGLLGVLDEVGFPPGRVAVEVTEEILISNTEAAKANLHALQEAGVVVCLDDFGTGYANYSQLLEFPFDSLKIDRSFVTDLGTGGDVSSLVRSMIDLTRNLDCRVIAEGIETPEALRELRALGCALGQGYLFSAPLPGDVARRLLAEGNAVLKPIAGA